MVKRILTSVITLCLCSVFVVSGGTLKVLADNSETTARDVNSITLKEVGDANDHESILSNHSSVSTMVQVIDNGDGVGPLVYGADSYTMYMEKDLVFFSYDFQSFEDASLVQEDGLIKENSATYRDVDGSGNEEYIYAWYAMNEGDAPYITFNLDYYNLLEFPEDNSEVILLAVDNGDGTISLVTKCEIEDVPDIAETPEEWDGASYIFVYVLDKDTLEVQALATNIATSNSVIPFIVQSFQYDVSRPEGCTKIIAHDESMDLNDVNQNDCRTIKIVYNPGEYNEEIFEKVFDNDNKAMIVTKEGYTKYSDPNGEEYFTGSDGKSDVVIYAIQD